MVKNIIPLSHFHDADKYFPSSPSTTLMKQIGFQDFLKIEMRVGTIIEAKVFEAAKSPAYILEIDFGKEIGIRKSSAQITDLYELSDLKGRQVIAVVNFPPKQIANIMSEVLVLGAVDTDKKVYLLGSDRLIPNGLRIG